MLDIFYPSLRAFVRACREIQLWLVENGLPESAATYDPRTLLARRVMVLRPTGAVIAPNYF